MLGRRITDEDDIFAAENDLLAQANAGEAASDDLLASFEALGSEARWVPFGGSVKAPPMLIAEMSVSGS